MNAFRSALSFLLCNRYSVVLLAGVLWFSAPYLPEAHRQMVSFAIVNMLLAQSINILTGMVGQMSIGHAAFMGMAAYTSVLMVKSAHLPLLLSVPCAVLLSALVGYLLSFPAARVKEFYLAMMTLGFGMIFAEIVREWDSLTGGVMGITGTPSPQLRTLSIFGSAITTLDYLRILLGVGLLVLFLLDRFVRSRFGRAFFAIHVSDIAARSIGIDSGRLKRQAYVLSAGLAGLAGALYGHLVSYIGPEAFEIGRSIEILVMSIIGGLGSLAGQVLGAMLLTWLPMQLEAFADYKFIAYGVVLTTIFIVMPRGFAGLLFLPPRFINPGMAQAPAGSSGEAPARRERKAGVEVLRWEGLRRDFAGLTAVADFSFSVQSGQVIALVGPNGSGKSTTVNVLTGIYAPSAGRVILKGEDISGMSSQQIAMRGMVRTFQDPHLVGRFTVMENVLLGAHIHYPYSMVEAATGLGRTRAREQAAIARADAVLALTGLAEVRDRVLETLPYGYRRLVEVARAVMVDPDVLLLDEPAAGLSENEMLRLADVVRRLGAEGVAVLIIDHHMDFLAELVHGVVVLDSGEEIFRGDMAGMRNDARVAECYLGRPEQQDA